MDLSIFANPNFDPNDYANAILAGEPYVPHQHGDKTVPATGASAGGTSKADVAAKEDVSVAISKLSFGIDDVSKQIKSLVSAHHEDLLAQAASASALSGSLTSVRAGLNDLDASLEKIRAKVRTPYQSLQTHVARLQKAQEASDVLRRMSRFVVLARRLQVQMRTMGDVESVGEANDGGDAAITLNTGGEQDDNKERTIAKAALTISELSILIDGPDPASTSQEDTGKLPDGPAKGRSPAISLRDINAVAAHIPFIEDARAKVNSEMESMVLSGLTTLDQSLLAASLQTAYNLRVLPELVQGLVQDLAQAVEQRIHSAFDLNKISRDAAKDTGPTTSPQSHSQIYKSRVRTEPTNITVPQWTAALWTRLEGLIEEMAACCIKVYALEKVLKMKKDSSTQTVFLDEAMKLLENKPSSTFWISLGRSLEKSTKESAKSSTFLQQTLSTGYPRLLRLFHEFFAKIAVHTDTVYTQTQQSPETVIVLRALSNLEALYLSRSSNRLNEAVAQAFSGGARSPPSMSDGVNIARTVANELDSARFDPLLVRSVAKNAVTSLEMMLSRADALIVRDRAATSLAGPAATPQQIANGQVGTCLYHCWERLSKLEEEYADAVFTILQPSIHSIKLAFDRLVEPLLTAIRRELGAIIARLHRIDFGKPFDPMSGMGGTSLYMKDLIEKLSFIKLEVLSQLNVADAGREWVMSIVRFVMKTFVLHVSIAKPLGESGKLQLTSDMTELEFALSAFLVDSPQSKRGGNLETVGDEYRVLRAMRPLLFLENAQLASSQHTIGLSPIVVLHHILVRSPVPLPHSLHSWQEAEYVRWVDEHSEEEVWTLVESSLSHWEKISESEGKDTAEAMEYVHLARRVLANARSR